jgi:hypothetical protein
MLQFFQVTVPSSLAPTVVFDNSLDTSFLIPVLFFIVALAFALAILFFLRSRAHHGAAMRQGEAATVTLRVTVPRFRTEEQVREQVVQQKVAEVIAIAETFYAAIGGLKPQHGWRVWWSGRADIVALEIIAHEKLVTFYITVPKFMQEFLEQQLHAQYSDAAIEEVGDYNIFTPNSVVVGGYLKFKRENILPIKTYKELESDPLNAITNALAKIPENEGVALQLLVRVAHSGWRSKGVKVVKNMQKGMTYKEAIKGHGKSAEGLKGWTRSKEDKEKSEAKQSQRRLSPSEEKMVQGIENKLSKAAMEVNVRIVASGTSVDSAKAGMNHVLQAFSQFNIYEFGNAFEAKIPSNKNELVNNFIYRVFDDHFKIILNTEELASIWHLPLPTTETPNIRWMAARVAPAPINIPTAGLHLGHNIFRGKRTEIFMKEGDRLRHNYIIGKTGSGKSWFLRYMAVQDIKNGKGVCVVDPHGDLVDSILGSIPKDRIDDVIYFNPSDTERPMGLNMLEAREAQEKDFAIQEMVAIFYQLFPPEMIGPMFEHQMRNYMATLMSDPERAGTIVEIPRIVTDDKFQKRWRTKVTDPVVRSFWEDEMDKTSDFHKSEMFGYIVSKVGRFVENEMLRNIIGQSESAFNFREVMDKGKILLVNLSKGKTGEINANLLGMIIVSKLQAAAFARADMPEEQRKDFFLYIDEFQNFITPSIATILSEARKYKLSLILAHQYMGQLIKDGRTEIRDAILGNVGNMLVSRIGPEDAEVLEKIFAPTFSRFDLMNNEKQTWNIKMLIDESAAKPFSLKAGTPDKPNPKLAEALKLISRQEYGRPKEIVEREIMLRAGIGTKVPGGQPTPPAALAEPMGG